MVVERADAATLALRSIREETGIPLHTWLRFLKRLAELLGENNHPGEVTIDQAVTDEMRLQGKIVPSGLIPERLSRLIPAERLRRALKPGVPVVPDQKLGERLKAWLETGKYELDDLFREDYVPVGNFWTTWTSVLEEALAATGLDDVCDRLAAAGIRECDWVVELRYSRESVPEAFHKPTLLDAGDMSGFRPTEDSEPMGWTRQPRTGERGFPEVVHRPVPMGRMEAVLTRGHRKRDLPEPEEESAS